jgi:hypothetical protein
VRCFGLVDFPWKVNCLLHYITLAIIIPYNVNTIPRNVNYLQYKHQMLITYNTIKSHNVKEHGLNLYRRPNFRIHLWLTENKALKIIFGSKTELHVTNSLILFSSQISAANLTLMWQSVVKLFISTTNKMQRYTIFFIVVSALHVSSGFSTHH